MQQAHLRGTSGSLTARLGGRQAPPPGFVTGRRSVGGGRSRTTEYVLAIYYGLHLRILQHEHIYEAVITRHQKVSLRLVRLPIITNRKLLVVPAATGTKHACFKTRNSGVCLKDIAEQRRSIHRLQKWTKEIEGSTSSTVWTEDARYASRGHKSP